MKIEADLLEWLRDVTAAHKTSSSEHVKELLVAAIAAELLGFFDSELADEAYTLPQFRCPFGVLYFRVLNPDIPDSIDKYSWIISLRTGEVTRK